MAVDEPMPGDQTVSITRVPAAERALIHDLYPTYIEAMSAFVSVPTTADGALRFDPAWQEPHHHPYAIRCGQHLAGFALLRPAAADTGIHDMGQFFVRPEYRRAGVGERAARLCLAAHPGHWQIRVLLNNQPALSFWEHVIAAATGGTYTATQEFDEDLRMQFFRFAC
ncbi:N-acetyltransferase GCN5 [Salinisphaera hydrothermalis C27AD]